RETANAATDGVCPDWTRLAVRHVARNCDLECPTHGEDREECAQWDRYDDSSHMTLWHPGVARLVADMLSCAADLDPSERETVALDRCGMCGTAHLTDIALALTGES
ncbi:hypothetical protein, partial [Nocardiopsis tropica]